MLRPCECGGLSSNERFPIFFGSGGIRISAEPFFETNEPERKWGSANPEGNSESMSVMGYCARDAYAAGAIWFAHTGRRAWSIRKEGSPPYRGRQGESYQSVEVLSRPF